MAFVILLDRLHHLLDLQLLALQLLDLQFKGVIQFAALPSLDVFAAHDAVRIDTPILEAERAHPGHTVPLVLFFLRDPFVQVAAQVFLKEILQLFVVIDPHAARLEQLEQDQRSKDERQECRYSVFGRPVLRIFREAV